MYIPYIGISDFKTLKQVRMMQEVFRAHLPKDSRRILHVGVVMSYETLHNIETEWSNVFPEKETIASIFTLEDVYNCLHYVDYDHNLRLGSSLARAISYGGRNIHAVQLDMLWPDPNQIAQGLNASHKKIEITLQIGKNAIEGSNNDPQLIVRRLEDYEGVIHRVLLDKSMGRGIGMDANGLIPLARAIRKRFPDLGLVVAGGLGPKTINLVRPLAAEFPDISIDAQGRLRPSGNALDPINWDMAKEYVIRALNLLG